MNPHFPKGICAGICIALGCTAYLLVENRYAAAALFSLALVCICYKEYSLFTGMAGYFPSTISFSNLLIALFGNYVGICLAAWPLVLLQSELFYKAADLMAAKLTTPWYSWIGKGLLCGVIMYLAVSIYRTRHSIAAILIGIPVFLLCGFEHSIADICYWLLGGPATFAWKGILFLITILISNLIGAMAMAELEAIANAVSGKNK